MLAKSHSSAAIAAIAVLASNAVFAQAPPPTVIITFSGATAVPLDLWSSVAAGLLIAAAAYAFSRRSVAGRGGKLSAWLAVIAAAAGVVVGASRLDIIASAHALAPIQIQVPLTASPANIVVGQSDAFLEVRNATNTPITINAISLANPAAGQGIFPGPAPNCQAGLTLAVNQICNLIVAFELE